MGLEQGIEPEQQSRHLGGALHMGERNTDRVACRRSWRPAGWSASLRASARAASFPCRARRTSPIWRGPQRGDRRRQRWLLDRGEVAEGFGQSSAGPRGHGELSCVRGRRPRDGPRFLPAASPDRCGSVRYDLEHLVFGRPPPAWSIGGLHPCRPRTTTLASSTASVPATVSPATAGLRRFPPGSLRPACARRARTGSPATNRPGPRPVLQPMRSGGSGSLCRHFRQTVSRSCGRPTGATGRAGPP